MRRSGLGIAFVEEPDTLCTGEPVFEPDDEDPFPVVCGGTAADTSVDVTCTATQELDPLMFPGCELTLTYTLVGSRDGDRIDATFRRSVEWTGCPPEFEDECFEAVAEAIRTGEDPECTPVPVRGVSWAKIKTTF